MLVGVVLTLVGCSDMPYGSTTVTNGTGEMIRVTGNCVSDNALTLMHGQTTNDVYLGAQRRIDNGDGLHGMLACVTLSAAHTDITPADLKDPPDRHQGRGPGPQ